MASLSISTKHILVTAAHLLGPARYRGNLLHSSTSIILRLGGNRYSRSSSSSRFGSNDNDNDNNGMEDEEFAESAERLGDRALRGKGRGGGGRDRRGGGKGGRGGGGGGGQDREVLISRALSSLLRHQAENAGIRLDGEGYAPLDKVVSPSRLIFSNL